MNIGIDIDGVLTNLEEYIMSYGSKFADDNKLEFDFNMTSNSVYGFITKEHSHKFWDMNWFKYAETVPVRPGASEVIKKLKTEGNKIIIITARTHDSQIIKHGAQCQKRMEEIIIKWLNKNNIYYDKIIFSNLSKKEHCLENKIDIMIEDSVSNIEQLKNYTKILCFNAKYNKYYEDKKIKRVSNWNEIYEIISKL